MEAILRKWGNSVGLRIPSGLLAELDLAVSSTVDLLVENGKLIIVPRREKVWKYSIEQLLSGVTEENMHPETDWGGPVGDEAS